MKRDSLPSERYGITHKIKIGETELYLKTSEYPGGRLGGIDITISKEGDDKRVYRSVADLFSIGLEYGAPLQVIVGKLKGQQYEPAGITSNEQIPIAKSIVDYLARWLELKYLSPNIPSDGSNQSS